MIPQKTHRCDGRFRKCRPYLKGHRERELLRKVPDYRQSVRFVFTRDPIPF